MTMVLQAQSLALPGLRHGFFTRDGGVSAGVYASLNGGVGGTGSLGKIGSGTLVLAGSNSYTGGTTINAGTVSIASDGNLGNAGAGLAFAHASGFSAKHIR